MNKLLYRLFGGSRVINTIIGQFESMVGELTLAIAACSDQVAENEETEAAIMSAALQQRSALRQQNDDITADIEKARRIMSGLTALINGGK